MCEVNLLVRHQPHFSLNNTEYTNTVECYASIKRSEMESDGETTFSTTNSSKDHLNAEQTPQNNF